MEALWKRRAAATGNRIAVPVCGNADLARFSRQTAADGSTAEALSEYGGQTPSRVRSRSPIALGPTQERGRPLGGRRVRRGRRVNSDGLSVPRLCEKLHA